MKKRVLLLMLLVFLMSGIIWAQESNELVIVGYPLGVGGSVGDDFYAPYKAELKSRADILNANPDAIAYLTGGADKNRYHNDNDAKNPGLALGRANDLKRYLIEKFGVDSTQLIVQTAEPSGKGDKFRYSSIRLGYSPPSTSRVDTTYLAPQIIIRETNNYFDDFGLNLSIGIFSSPYGALPIVSGAVVYKNRLHVEAQFGHTFWDDQRDLAGMSLPVWQRMSGGQLIYYVIDRPAQSFQFGLTAGWFRIEEISKDFYGYTHMSEGPTFGARLHFLKFLNLSGSYFPHKERLAERQLAFTKDGTFLFSLTVNHSFGGGK